MLANIKYKLAAATGSKRTTAAQKDQKFYGPTKDDIVFVAEYDRMVGNPILLVKDVLLIDRRLPILNLRRDSSVSRTYGDGKSQPIR
jgi:hypothetical protein